MGQETKDAWILGEKVRVAGKNKRLAPILPDILYNLKDKEGDPDLLTPEDLFTPENMQVGPMIRICSDLKFVVMVGRFSSFSALLTRLWRGVVNHWPVNNSPPAP